MKIERLTKRVNKILSDMKLVYYKEDKTEYRDTKSVILDYDKSLFELLRTKRKELADKANVPPYVIFSDKSLIEMSVYFPMSEDNFINMHGVGKTKIEKYGGVFTSIIKNYCLQHKLQEKIKVKRRGSKVTLGKRRFMEVGESFNAGKSVTALMKGYSVKQRTIISHLASYIQDGHSLNADKVLSLSKLTPERHTDVRSKFKETGAELLRPVFEAFNGEISYDELRIMMVAYLSKAQ